MIECHLGECLIFSIVYNSKEHSYRHGVVSVLTVPIDMLLIGLLTNTEIVVKNYIFLQTKTQNNTEKESIDLLLNDMFDAMIALT
jgi:hypothetical protein